jgi:FkbM family methyltransferase
MQSSISLKKLPNGFKVSFPKKDIFQFYDETTFFYEEVQDYFKNGIVCSEGDTIFDVGANIGLFTIHAHSKYNQNINIYAFEPIPQIFKSLFLNTQKLNSENVKIFPFGCSNESKVEIFSYHPNAPGMSSMYPDNSLEQQQAIRNNIIENLEHAPRRIRQLISFVPPFLRSFFIDRDLDRIFQTEKIDCQLQKLSDVIKENNIQKINLLKIDVERCELNVLLGLETQDWQKIEQIVIEIHDTENQLEIIKTLLTQQGFSKITIEQNPFLKASKNFVLYAIR